MEMERLDSRIRGAQFAYDQGLHAYKELLSQTCYKTFKCGDLVAVEKMSQLMAERLQQQHAVIKSLLYFLAAQGSESVPGTFLPTLVDLTLETEEGIQKGIESAIKRIETTRCQARIAHALRSRLVGRDLSMLDLPNETLLNIIEFVSHKSMTDYSNLSDLHTARPPTCDEPSILGHREHPEPPPRMPTSEQLELTVSSPHTVDSNGPRRNGTSGGSLPPPVHLKRSPIS